MRRAEILTRERKRILVFRIGELGDTLIAIPALSALRAAFPAAHISLLSNSDPDSRHVSPVDILPRGLIDESLTYRSQDYRTGRRERLLLLSKLRRETFDLLVYLAPRIRKPRDVRRDLLFFRIAGITRVIGASGFDPLPQRNGGPLPTVSHEADHLLARLALDGIAVPGAGDCSFELNLTSDEKQVATDWLDQQVPLDRLSALIAFGPASKWESKVWPEARFIELGARLIKELSIFPVVFGSAEDRTLGDRLIKAWGVGANAAGQLSVREAAAALERCKFYVGNDTGTMHLAAAVGRPCVAIMAAIDWPGHWNPYGNQHIVLRKAVPCEGCLLQVCEHEAMRCLKEISVEEVFTACSRLLDR